MRAPTGEERKICHAARDSYFDCLSLNNNDESACSKEKELYNGVCPSAWVGTVGFDVGYSYLGSYFK